MSTERPTPADYELAVAGATYRVVDMRRTHTPDILVEVSQDTGPWLEGGPHDAVLRLRDGAARYDGTYIVIGYHYDEGKITTRGVFRRREGSPDHAAAA